MKHLLLSLLILLSAAVFTGCSTSADQQSCTQSKKTVIFDTDMGNDIDDALALQMLFNYEKKGMVDIKGICISKCNPMSISFVDGLCRFNGYENMPLGYAYHGVNPEDNKYLRPTLEATWNGEKLLCSERNEKSGIPEGYLALRQWLWECADSSVTLIATGPLTNIANLLDSPADEICELDGIGLVSQKVEGLYIMSGLYPEGAEWNVLQDIQASVTVYEKCPVPIVASGWEVGAAIRYPHESILNDFGDPASNPLCVAYMSYMPMPYDRECWDLTTVFDAIEADSTAFVRSDPGTITVDEKGNTIFTPSNDGNRRYLMVSDTLMARTSLVDRVTSRQ